MSNNPTLNSSLNTAAKDKFIMTLDLPYVLRQTKDPLLDINSVQMSVFGTIIPNISVPSVEARFLGQSTNFSSHSRPNYEPLNINFLINNDYKNYYILWKWLNLLNSATGSEYLGSPLHNREKARIGPIAEYQSTFNIVSLDEYNEPVVTFTYKNAFITNLGGIQYTYREGDIIEATAQFAFGQLDMAIAKNISVLDK